MKFMNLVPSVELSRLCKWTGLGDKRVSPDLTMASDSLCHPAVNMPVTSNWCETACHCCNVDVITACLTSGSAFVCHLMKIIVEAGPRR